MRGLEEETDESENKEDGCERKCRGEITHAKDDRDQKQKESSIEGRG